MAGLKFSRPLIGAGILIMILAATVVWMASRPPVERIVTISKPPEKIEYIVGVPIAVSGPYEVEGPFRRDGALLAIEQMNALLATAGSPVTFRAIHEDSKGTPEGALAAIEALSAAGAKIVVGPLSSAEVQGIRSFCDSHRIVCISPSSTAPQLALPGDYIFRVAQTDLAQAKALAQLVAETGYAKVAAIARDDDYGRGISDAFSKSFTETGAQSKRFYSPRAYRAMRPM